MPSQGHDSDSPVVFGSTTFYWPPSFNHYAKHTYQASLCCFRNTLLKMSQYLLFSTNPLLPPSVNAHALPSLSPTFGLLLLLSLLFWKSSAVSVLRQGPVNKSIIGDELYNNTGIMCFSHTGVF